ncbi:hypothetical protein GCK72_003768 [Caenorhabditis remanei]|uniref:Sdz-33 F-box domain-containing protein n=1 Tax=Caenorhabditis remanei TaxID=31234 RepID=A0A6A5HBP6_CAERE|nr:hypothetical protein GCK72_003768 [Caenorhabditis remanei]KAF1763822.1 hypothetical protein GCK72_003768 [Caenorhabditis remanei]
MEGILVMQPMLSTFPLRKLPFVALKHAIKVMEIDEIVKIAITSKYMESIVKFCCIRIRGTIVSLDGEFTYVGLYYPEVILFCCTKTFNHPSAPKLTKEDLEPWLSETSTTLENTRQLFTRIYKLFQCGPYRLMINSSTENIKEILEIPEFRNFTVLFLVGGHFKKEQLDEVLEFEREDQDLHILKSEIPEDYYHPNLFKYAGVHYCDARWIRLEHLLSIKNNDVITLGKNNLTIPDLNKFLHHWMNSEYDLFNWMTIDIEKGPSIPLDVLFSEITVLRGYRFGKWRRLISVNSPKTRNRQIMSIVWTDSRIDMSTWSIHERPKQGDRDDEPYASEFEVLQLLKQRRVLNSKLNIMEEDSLEKQEITKKIDGTRQQLQLKGVEFNNGWPFLRGIDASSRVLA